MACGLSRRQREAEPVATQATLRGVVRLAGYRSQRADTIDLLAEHQHLTLLIIPPKTSAQPAHRALTRAGQRGNLHSPAELLGEALLSDRDRINAELKAVIDAPTEEPWGLRVERVEVRDVALPDGMKRSMSRQAEAERERRARIIAADGEIQASTKLAQAAEAMGDTPGALQLRLLQTVVDVAAEKNSTLVMPFPVELLRFFDKHLDHEQQAATTQAPTDTSNGHKASAPLGGGAAPASPVIPTPAATAPDGAMTPGTGIG